MGKRGGGEGGNMTEDWTPMFQIDREIDAPAILDFVYFALTRCNVFGHQTHQNVTQMAVRPVSVHPVMVFIGVI